VTAAAYQGSQRPLAVILLESYILICLCLSVLLGYCNILFGPFQAHVSMRDIARLLENPWH